MRILYRFKNIKYKYSVIIMTFYNELNYNKSNLHEQLDNAIVMKHNSNYNDTFGDKMMSTTREKIFKQAIHIFKLIRHNRGQEISTETQILSKRIKIHLYQLRKAKQDNYNEQYEFFKYLMKFIYTYLLNQKLNLVNINKNNA